MSTHVPGFCLFFRFFASLCNGKISHQQHEGKGRFLSPGVLGLKGLRSSAVCGKPSQKKQMEVCLLVEDGRKVTQ